MKREAADYGSLSFLFNLFVLVTSNDQFFVSLQADTIL